MLSRRVYYGSSGHSPRSVTDKLQRVSNAAARVAGPVCWNALANYLKSSKSDLSFN